MHLIPTRNAHFNLQFATPDDAACVVGFMHQLGRYQKMADKIIATEAGIRQLLADKKGEVVFGVFKGERVGMVYFCQTSSAFIGQSGLYIDAFLIDERLRHQGLGRIMMSFMSKLALERGCQRLEWGCLDWNEPTLRFYKSMGAYGVDAMTIHRFAPGQLKTNADLF
jgi:GNAT superfamily N-acetyltransferase